MSCCGLGPQHRNLAQEGGHNSARNSWHFRKEGTRRTETRDGPGWVNCHCRCAAHERLRPPSVRWPSSSSQVEPVLPSSWDCPSDPGSREKGRTKACGCTKASSWHPEHQRPTEQVSRPTKAESQLSPVLWLSHGGLTSWTAPGSGHGTPTVLTYAQTPCPPSTM